MKLKFFRADPAGNITLLVTTPVKKDLYATVAAKLLSQTQYKAEQVGYLVPPKTEGICRLEMMGGEFCGNALRSAGFLYAREKHISDDCPIAMEISGYEGILYATANLHAMTAKTEMPLPQSIGTLKVGNALYPVVSFAGITHVLLCDQEWSEAVIPDILEAVYSQEKSLAVGLMDVHTKSMRMRPIVHVKETGTLIYENSCASGTAAAGIWFASSQPDGGYAYAIRQPGGVIHIDIEKKDGKLSSYIHGNISLSTEMETEIDISEKS